MLALILNALTGGVAHELAAAFRAHEDAQTDQERIAAQERINHLQAIADVQKAEAGNPINALIRAAFAVPIALYFAKLFLWDKVLGWGSTDSLSPELWQLALVVIGFYFLHDTATGIARIVRR
jgi:sterol desaturase/sphingolipid hydroxylase (fatty acid hydroxylase superfamily)